MTITPDSSKNVSASVGDGKLLDDTGAETENTEQANLAGVLETAGADNTTVADVNLSYDAANDKWEINYTDAEGNQGTAQQVYLNDEGDGTWTVHSAATPATDGTTQIMTIKPSDTSIDEDALKEAFGVVDGQKVAAMGAAPVSGTLNGAVQKIQPGVSEASSQLANATLDLSDYFKADGSKITLGDTTYTVAVGKDSKFKGAKNVIDLTALDVNDADFAMKAAERLTAAAKGNTTFSVGANKDGKTTIQQLQAVKDSTDMTTFEGFASYLGFEKADAESLKNVTTAKGLTLQIGDTSESFNQLTVSIGDIHAAALGVGGLSVSTQEDAAAAINTIKNAINSVSSIRGTLGATQNRLEHTANNLSVMSENIQDAESTIRDTDIAEEMMSYTKNNILVQSAQAMLAQANQVPQGVLQLLG